MEDIENDNTDEQTKEIGRHMARRLADPSRWEMPSEPITVDHLKGDERAYYDTLSEQVQNAYLGQLNHSLAELEQSIPSSGRMAQVRMDVAAENAKNQLEIPFARTDPRELGYWGDDEDDEFGQVEDDDDDWDESMMTSVAESQLELHREIREYMRVTAWDMPLLNSNITLDNVRKCC